MPSCCFEPSRLTSISRSTSVCSRKKPTPPRVDPHPWLERTLKRRRQDPANQLAQQSIVVASQRILAADSARHLGGGRVAGQTRLETTRRRLFARRHLQGPS